MLSGQLRQEGVVLLERVTDCTKLTLDGFRCGYTSDELAAGCCGGSGWNRSFRAAAKVVLMFSPADR